MTSGALRSCADMTIADHDPGLVIAAVADLVALGKDGALAEVQSASDGSGVGLFWVLRVLFDVPPDAGFPPVRIGRPNVAPPPGDALPRFPIVIAADVPLLVVRAYVLGGAPELVDSHVAFFREHGSIRGAPLSPAPGDAEDAFLRHYEQAYGEAAAPEVADWVRQQLARM